MTLDHVAAWRSFAATLGDAGQALAWDGLELDDLDRAEALRYLARLAANAVGGLQDRHPAHPSFELVPHGFGMDNPDNRYLSAAIDPRHEYQITGTRGTLSYLSLAAQNQNFARSDSITGGAGHLHGDELELDDDGGFTIVASADPQPGNWLRLADDSRMILMRQTRADPETERWGEVDIAYTATAAPPPPLDHERIEARLAMVAHYAAGAAMWFTEWVRPWLERPNSLAFADPDEQRLVGGDPNIVAQSGYWVLEPHEMLVVEIDPPRCAYWNIQLGNVWAESLDTRRPVWKNNATAVADANGTVRLVVAHRDPGHPNWLDTAGHRHGTIHVRYVLADSLPPARTSVVPFE